MIEPAQVPAKVKVGIVFDDGFIKSTLATADLFEQFGLRAVFAVLANPAGFAPNIPVGDFSLWNELQARGHIVQPHGYTHANLASMSYPDAIAEIERCLETFQQKLIGFDPANAVYCCTYNQATPALCQWLLRKVGAVRIGGSGMLGQAQIDSRIWHSRCEGPHDPGTDFLDHLHLASRDRPAALFYVLHGLDGEGWGAIAHDRLHRCLDLLMSDPLLEYWLITAPNPEVI